MTMTSTLVTRDVLRVLDAAGIRYELVDTGSEATTLRFDHQAFDRLREFVDETQGRREAHARRHGTGNEMWRNAWAAA